MKNNFINQIEVFLSSERLSFSKMDDNTIIISFTENNNILNIAVIFDEDYILSLAYKALSDTLKNTIADSCNAFNSENRTKLFYVKNNKNKLFIFSEASYNLKIFSGEHLEEWLKESFVIHSNALRNYKHSE